MRSVITQSVVLPAVPEELFDMYLDPAKHTAFTGSEVTIGPDPGSEFRGFDGQLSGTILVTMRPTLIVQSWRSVNFNESDLDSTLVLTFAGDPAGGRVDLVHLDVPEQDFQGVSDGWEKYYWKPWRAYLTGR